LFRLASSLIFVLLLLSLVHADETATVSIFKYGNVTYVSVSNPSASTINITVLDKDGNAVYSIEKTDTSFIQDISLSQGRYTFIVRQNGAEITKQTVTYGSIFNSGFKSTMYGVFEGNWLPIAVTILFGVGVMAVSIGRYAGVPIMLSALIILATNNYIPSWSIYVILLMVTFLFAEALFKKFKEA